MFLEFLYNKLINLYFIYDRFCSKKVKKLGQYFLTDKNYIHRITDSIINSKPNHVVEIGPGKGALTAILKAEVSLDLIEIDQDWVTVWRDRGVRVFDQDAAKFDYGALSKQLSEKITVCGNLPYYALCNTYIVSAFKI